MDKKTLLAINGVLLVAVIFLFFKVFTMKPGEGTTTTVTQPTGPSAEEIVGQVVGAFEDDTTQKKLASVAFVVSDSLLNNYDFVKFMDEQLLRKENSIMYTLDAKTEELNEMAKRLEEDVYALTENEYYQREAEIQQFYMEGQQLQYDLETEYAELQAQLYAELYERVTEFLDRYGALHNFDYVLQVSATGGVLYANESLDITSPVITGLNAEYAAEQTSAVQ